MNIYVYILGDFSDIIFKLKNFFPLWEPDEIMGFKSYLTLKCNLDHGSEFRNNQSWPKGSDYVLIDGKKKKEWYHPGIHFQYHIADFFYDLYRFQLNKIISI